MNGNKIYRSHSRPTSPQCLLHAASSPPARAIRTRRGGVYISVLGAAMLVSLIGLTALAAVRLERVSIATTADAEQARLYAQSAVELGAQLVQNDPLWRTTRTSGVWIADRRIGDGRFTLEGIDPIDGNFLNRPTDPLLLRATATRGRARQVVQARLDARGEPLNVLETALYATGDVRIRGTTSVNIIGNIPLGTGQTLRNDGVVAGNAECLLYTGTGTVSGTLDIAAAPRILPTSDTFAMYADLGTPISPGGVIDRRLLAPGVNPWGQTDPDGVYVIRTNSNLTIRDSRIHGTLVIIAPGKTVTFTGRVLIHTASEDYPALLVHGDVVFNQYSDQPLSESALGVNFNPPAAPYQGISNTDIADTYPSEIQGLVHIRGTLEVTGEPRIHGTVIIESPAGSQSLDVRDVFELEYDPQALANPPMGYMDVLQMKMRPRSWRQVVAP
jgi:hypothetical protein